jgi:hypothetical protein
VKFSVRSDGSLNVSWMDGPSVPQVEAIAKQFAGSYFDGMIDYQGSKYHTLDGEAVHLGADFVFCSREYSDKLIERAIKFVAAKFGAALEGITVAKFRNGDLYNVYPIGNADGLGHWSWQNQVNSARYRMAERAYLLPGFKCATLERLKPAGDDGYGAGTVGHDGKGGNQAYVAMSAARDRQAAKAAIAQVARNVVLQ